MPMLSTVTRAVLQLHALSPEKALAFVATLDMNRHENSTRGDGGLTLAPDPLACHLVHTRVPEICHSVVARTTEMTPHVRRMAVRALIEHVPEGWWEDPSVPLWEEWLQSPQGNPEDFRIFVNDLMRHAAQRPSESCWRTLGALRAHLLPLDKPLPKGFVGDPAAFVQRWTGAAILQHPGAHALLASWLPQLSTAAVVPLIAPAVEGGAIGPLVAGLKAHPNPSVPWRRSLGAALLATLKARVWPAAPEKGEAPPDDQATKLQVETWEALMGSAAGRDALGKAALAAAGLDLGIGEDPLNPHEQRKTVAQLAPFAHVFGADWRTGVQSQAPGEQELASLIYSQDRAYAQARVALATDPDPVSLEKAVRQQLSVWTPAHPIDAAHLGDLIDRGWLPPNLPLPALKHQKHQEAFRETWLRVALELGTRAALYRPSPNRPRL